MTPERRFTDDEAAAIFDQAARDEQRVRSESPRAEGMTLAQLQDIGREAGIPAHLVAAAAKSLDQPALGAPRRFLGLPIGVGRTIELDRKLTDPEWEHLVGELREIFEARGAVRYDGAFRQWTNGNLQVLLEPTATGHRVRMRTTNGGARPLMTAGLALFGMAVVPALIGAFAGGLDASMIRSGAMLFVTGAGTFAVGALRLPGWARVRQQQMDTIAERLLLVTRMSPIEPSALPSAAPSALPPRAPASLPAATEE
ncbi:MAG: hypothetical protein IPF98_09460 [Gemmatimonadetes bacterium]|nr:hypothetical protein [Gemmatimonadota bacterium]MCC6771884.1 hypothetical protein [Gemmatimonadaceae bacterium]